jgi:endonuclease/exonuclease/phosphatase family metal-dependent hydrolase
MIRSERSETTLKVEAEAPSRAVRVTGIALRLAIWTYAAAMLVVLAIALIGPPDAGLAEFALTVGVLALWLAPVMLIVTLLARPRLAWTVLPALIGFALMHGATFVRSAPTVPDDAPRLTVMTFNIRATNAGLDRITPILADSGADIITLQEVSYYGANYISTALARLYPHQAFYTRDEAGLDHPGGQALLSRYPITAVEYWTDDPAQPSANRFQRAEIDFNGTTLVIYNTHPATPVDWSGGLVVSASPGDDARHRAALQAIAARAAAETAPVIWLGDFNMSEQFAEYARITADFTDAYRESASGPGYSYPADGFGPLPPLIRLDYVFHSRHFISASARVLRAHGPSDHRPVLATLALIAPG